MDWSATLLAGSPLASFGAAAVTLMTGVAPAPAAGACEWTCAPPPRTAVLEPARCCRVLRAGKGAELLTRRAARLFPSPPAVGESCSDSAWSGSWSGLAVRGDGEGDGEGNEATIMSGCAIGAWSGREAVAAAAATMFSAHVRHMCVPWHCGPTRGIAGIESHRTSGWRKCSAESESDPVSEPARALQRGTPNGIPALVVVEADDEDDSAVGGWRVASCIEALDTR